VFKVTAHVVSSQGAQRFSAAVLPRKLFDQKHPSTKIKCVNRTTRRASHCAVIGNDKLGRFAFDNDYSITGG
jgi:hypothetical protein